MKTRFLYITLLISSIHQNAFCAESFGSQDGPFYDVSLTDDASPTLVKKCKWVSVERRDDEGENIASQLGLTLKKECKNSVTNNTIQSFFKSLEGDSFSTLECSHKKTKETAIIFAYIKEIGPSIVTFLHFKGKVASNLKSYYKKDDLGKPVCPLCE